ncbi:MAG: hypothetical protein LBK82_10680, partial [Planctomycetaceae bacterium]|nr:hypothetical protein [Planctomycetaceae bacterium]
EIKIKTAAVPLATVGKPAFGFDKDFNMTLKTVGQTMLSAKGADDLFGSGKPLNGADFAYKLLVSQDSKVDKVTGKLLGSAEIPLTIDSGSGGSIKIETLPAKGSVGAVSSGQYTLEYALTGEGGILEELKVSAANISSLKNLNFQLVTVVKYNGVSFDSVTKPGKVAMPKWFV